MITIKEFPKGISVVEIDGVYCVHSVDGPISFNISCDSLEQATRRAQAESWYKIMMEFEKEIHHVYRLTLQSTCLNCPYRDSCGCLGSSCPAHNVGEAIGKAVRLADKTVKRMKNW